MFFFQWKIDFIVLIIWNNYFIEFMIETMTEADAGMRDLFRNVLWIHRRATAMESWFSKVKKHSSRGVLRKRCFENTQQIYRGRSMPKCDFNKVEITLRYGFSPVNLPHIFRVPFSINTTRRLLLKIGDHGLNFSGIFQRNYFIIDMWRAASALSTRQKQRCRDANLTTLYGTNNTKHSFTLH